MTLARVGYDYPVDDVVQYFLDNQTDWDFGSKTFDSFRIGITEYKANLPSEESILHETFELLNN